MAARRALERIFTHMSFYAPRDFFDERRYAQAAYVLQIARLIKPTDGFACFWHARALAQPRRLLAQGGLLGRRIAYGPVKRACEPAPVHCQPITDHALEADQLGHGIREMVESAGHEHGARVGRAVRRRGGERTVATTR